MVSRSPTVSPFANTDSKLALVIGNGPNPRIIQLRPWAATSGAILTILLLGWYLTATLYFVFRDEMLSKLVGQQTEMQYAYEDRLAALRNQIDRVTSRQLVDQNSVEGKMHELISRQAQLETRHALIVALAEQPSVAQSRGLARPGKAAPDNALLTGSIAGGSRNDPATSALGYAPQPNRPTPTSETFELRNLGTRGLPPVGGPEKRLNSSSLLGLSPVIAVMELKDATDIIERQQLAALEQIEQNVRKGAQRWSQAFAETGLDASRFVSPAGKTGAQGGPLVPIQPGKNAGAFERKLSDAQFAIIQAERMRKIVNNLPLHRPMPAEYDITSGYGARSDPFTRGLAMHTGIDFRAPQGSPVRVTGAGKVVEAGWAGGYGNMVEVDHGNGLTSRYAHLSAITVSEGDMVAKGAVVGRVGSTGRSTGPHLHYETRLEGDAMDPMRFIRAGQKLSAN